MELKEYLQENKLTQSLFIEDVRKKKGVRIPQGTLAKWITGVRIPRKTELLLINEVTGGKVQPNDFFGVKYENRAKETR
tara:strand:- start:2434 stop:2670 length:237 start_codon:yes stop_codon:yes gene_type:complete